MLHRYWGIKGNEALDWPPNLACERVTFSLATHEVSRVKVYLELPRHMSVGTALVQVARQVVLYMIKFRNTFIYYNILDHSFLCLFLPGEGVHAARTPGNPSFPIRPRQTGGHRLQAHIW